MENMENHSSRSNFNLRPAASREKAVNSKFAVRILDAIVFVSVLMLFFGLPLFFTGLPLQGVVFEKQIYFYFWTLLALISWAGKGVLFGEMKVRRTPLDIPILLFWAAYLLTTVFSVDRWHSFIGLFGDPSRGFMDVTALIVVYYVIMSNFSEKLFRWIIGALISSGLIVFGWSVLAIFGIDFLPEKIAARAPLSLLGSVSGLGMFLGIMLPLILTVIFKIRSGAMARWRKDGLTAVLLIGLFADIFLLLALHGFVPWIGFMIGIGFFLIFILSRIVRPIESWSWLPIATFVILMVILMSGDSFKIAKVSLPVEVGPSYDLSWQVAKESLKDNFFLGSGAASYGYDFSLYKPQEFNLNQLYNLRFYQGTGVVLEALSTIGVVGTTALVLVLLSFVSVVVYFLIARKENDKVYSLGLATSALVFLLSAAMIRVEGSLIILGVLVSTVALAIAIRESDSEEKFFKLSLKASPKYALTLAFIFMVVSAGVAYLFVFVGKLYVADIYAGSALRQTQVTEEGSISEVLRAANLNGKESRYYINIGQQYMVLANNEILKEESARDVNALQNYLGNSIAAITRAKELAPNDVATVEVLAQTYAGAGAYLTDSSKLAEETYRRALELEPRNPAFVLELGRIRLGQAAAAKEEEKKQLIGQAQEFFQQSIDEKNNFAPGYHQLAVAQAALGNLDQAIETMNKAVNLDKSSIDYFFSLARLYQQRGNGDDNKIAEAIFKKILSVNDKEINTHFSLAMLYEKMNETDKAIAEYNLVIGQLPVDNAEAISKVRMMIENVRNGAGNPAQAEPAPPQENQPAGQ